MHLDGELRADLEARLTLSAGTIEDPAADLRPLAEPRRGAARPLAETLSATELGEVVKSDVVNR